MFPGQSQQIPTLTLHPGYSSMIQHDDPNSMTPKVIMMSTHSGQQYAFAPAVYPIPQNAMVSGPLRFVPPPPPYTVQMASSLRSTMRDNGQELTEEQRRKMEKEWKQRQFMEQQRRLQDLSTVGSVKLDPDKLIESIIGKSDPGNKAPPAKSHSIATKTSHLKDISTVPSEDVFGEFLSSSTSSTSDETGNSEIRNISVRPATLVPSQLQSCFDDHSTQVEKAVIVSVGTALQSSVGKHPSGTEMVEAPLDKKRDLVSMMMQCSDLSAPKEAKRFEKVKVNEIQVTKSISVKYNESKTARHWDNSMESLSELFTLPAAQSSQLPHLFDTNSGNHLPGSEFRLPKWITGEIPIHEVYQQVLDVVIRDNVISTELVYPLLLRSGLPRETLGYIWELCNRNMPGQLIREELFLLLAMISIAQNGMDFSSLAILSKCPHAPIPNLGQFVNSSASQYTIPLSDTVGLSSPVEHLPVSVANTAAFPHNASHSVMTAESDMYSQVAYPVTSTGSTIPLQPSFVGPTASLQGPVPLQDSGYSSHGINGSFLLDVSKNPPTLSAVSSTNQSSVDNEEYEEFQAASLPHLGMFRPFAACANQVIIPPTSQEDSGLMKQDLTDPLDKYAVFRQLSTASELGPTNSTALSCMDHHPDSSSLAVITNASSATDLEFTDFESFIDAASSDVVLSSCNSDHLLGSSFAVTAGSDRQKTRIDELNEFSSEMKFSDFDSSGKFSTLKSLISDPSVFKTKLATGNLENQLVSSVSTSITGELASNGFSNCLGKEEDLWANFSSADSSHLSLTENKITLKSPAEPLQDSPVSSGNTSQLNDAGGWTEFESAFDLPRDKLQSTSSSGCDISVKGSVVSADSKDINRTKLNANQVQSYFWQKNDLRSPPLSLGVSPLDFHPPELPDEEDDPDVYPHFPKDAKSSVGISSLSTHFLEVDDHFDVLSEENNSFSTISGKSSALCGMTQSSSANSLEFTGWKIQPNTFVAEPDVQSTSSLELRQNKITESQNNSPQQDLDSQSVSSLDFPPAESEQKSTADEQSVASLELKLASPVSDAQQSGESRALDKITSPMDTSGIDFEKSGQHHPVDLKELLEQGSLGRFGDRYSELMDGVQDSDRHAYEWERCLEICHGFLSEGSQIFCSLSSSSVLHEILSTDEGLTYLRGVVEIYLIARRIEEEMKHVSVSSLKLASQVKNINMEWNDIGAICIGNPVIPSSSSLDFKSCFLKADDYEARRKACGVCLLNVDAKIPGTSSMETGSKALSYGGRQYHTACANFWINCVSKTLPSLTIPELL